MKQVALTLVLFGSVRILPTFAEEIRATLPDRNVDVSIELKDYRPSGVDSVPGKTIFIGTIEGGKVNFSFLFDEGKDMETGAKFRELWRHNWKLAGIQQFEGKEWACLDLIEPMPGGFKDVHYHAFRGIPGIGLHVHVSAVYSGEKRPFARAQFLDLVESIQILDRRSELTFPEAVGDLLAESSKHGPDTLAWIREQCRSRPDDYVPHQVLGMMAFVDEDPDGTIEGFGRSTELLGKKEPLADDEKFALEDAEFSLGWALYKQGRFDGALKIRRLQGESTYALACCHALVSDAASAVKYLKEAIALDPKYRKDAKTDKDFDKVRANAEFKKLLAAAK